MERGVEVYGAVAAEAALAQRRYEFRPVEGRRESPRELKDPRLVAMKEKLASKEGRAIYARRQTSVEPTFGIIKRVLGFRQFMLRGKNKVSGAWQLVALAYQLQTALPAAPGKERRSISVAEARAQLAPSIASAGAHRA
jgi:hypothetical protein